MASKKKKTSQGNLIADNRKARHDYQILDTIEAGLVLEGWEVKSLRAGRAQLRDSYVTFQRNEAWLIGAHFSPLSTVCKQTKADPYRQRKCLLNRREINQLAGCISRKGETIVPLNLHWKRGRVKLSIARAKGKKLYDKRQSEKEKTQKREMRRMDY